MKAVTVTIASPAFVTAPSQQRNLGVKENQSNPANRHLLHEFSSSSSRTMIMMAGDDWSSFSSLDDMDDDDDDDYDDDVRLDTRDYAVEEDSQECKAQVGSLYPAPTINHPADPIFVPAGSQLELSEETVLGVLSACRDELGTLFGYTPENRGVGITGGVDYVDMDGPTVVVSLKGRYWHQRTTVLDRISNYLRQRIPEIIEVTVQDPWQLTDEANEIW